MTERDTNNGGGCDRVVSEEFSGRNDRRETENAKNRVGKLGNFPASNEIIVTNTKTSDLARETKQVNLDDGGDAM